MSQKSLWTFKLITKVLFLKLQPILYCTHPRKKPNFFKVTKLTVYDIPLTAEKHIITLAMNRLACSQSLYAILCNLLHYRPCYGKTRVWGQYVYFWLSSQRVKFPGSCGTESVLALFKSTDNLNENVMGDTFWINDRWPVVHTFLFYVWLPISRLLLSD